MSTEVIKFDDGILINGDATDPEAIRLAAEELETHNSLCSLVVTDPPYGNILSNSWDKTVMSDDQFASWMVEWTKSWGQLLVDRGAFYVWGGIGKVGFRPFFKYVCEIEKHDYQLSTLITWSKRRAYGVKNNYLFTREELAYLVKGDAKRPRTFNIPLLPTIRGYAGYNKKYPAKSDHYRRTNVWTDVNELFRNKLHVAQKPLKVIQVPIEVHTNEGEYVIDPFAGSGTTAVAARSLGRKFIIVEKDKDECAKIVDRLSKSTEEIKGLASESLVLSPEQQDAEVANDEV